MIVSFNMTVEAFRARRKSVTRRYWKDQTGAKFQPGLVFDAWTASPHRGGKPLGICRVVSCIKEKTRDIPDSDWEAEGFAYMEEHGLLLGKDLDCAKHWRMWRQSEGEAYTLHFEILEVFPEAAPS